MSWLVVRPLGLRPRQLLVILPPGNLLGLIAAMGQDNRVITATGGTR